MQYRPEIDGLRAVAVISVVLFHAGFSLFSGGYVGVDIFFVISGYLITTIILNDINKDKFSLSEFYERRARRILPALICVVLVSTAVAYLMLLPDQLVAYGKSVVSIPLFVSNIFFWSERGYFGAATELKPMVHTWSLSVEEQFYLLYPPLVVLIVRYFKSKLPIILSAGFIVSITLSWYLTKIHFETAFYLPFARAWELLAGALVVVYKSSYPNHARKYDGAISFVGMTLIAYALCFFTADTVFPGLAAAIPVVGTALVLASNSGGNFTHKLLSKKPLVFIGLASYSIYLWHQPIFAFIRQLEVDAKWMPVGIAVTAAVSVLSYFYIEKPFRNRQRFDKKKIFLLSGIASVSLVAMGAFLVLNKGFINRFNPEDAKLLAQFSEIDGYNQRIFDSLNLKPFQESNKRKIFVTGDSYAKDILNVMYEGGFDKDFQFATKQINAECGNVYVDQDVSSFLPPKSLARCNLMGRYESDAVRKLIKQADEIWLIGAWAPWAVQFLPSTIRRLESEFNIKVRVFGIKNFGAINQKSALAVSPADRSNYRQPAQTEPTMTSKLMRNTVSASNFVDLFELLCGGNSSTCEIFTPDGYLISPDGAHLTKVGAQYLANRVKPLLYRNPGS
jgi:peptidoglycan/LPS O-acetylase OafA/YrhL